MRCVPNALHIPSRHSYLVLMICLLAVHFVVAQQPLMLRTTLFTPISETSAQFPIVVTDGLAFVATANSSVYVMPVDGGFPNETSRFKSGPFSSNITSLFPIDGDDTRVGVMGENYLIVIATRPAVHVEHVLESSIVGEQFQLLHRPYTHRGVIFFGTGCERANGCLAGRSFIVAVNAATGHIMWNVSAVDPTFSNRSSSSCANYPVVSFPVNSINHATVRVGNGTIVAVHDSCETAGSVEGSGGYILVLNASTGALINNVSARLGGGPVQRLGPVATVSLSPQFNGIGGVIVQQSESVSLLATPTSSSFSFSTHVPACNLVGAMPVTVDRFAVLSCNTSIALLDLSEAGAVHAVYQTTSIDNPTEFLAYPPGMVQDPLSLGVSTTSSDDRGGASANVVFVFTNYGDLYVIDAAGNAVILLPTPNASTATAQGLTLFRAVATNGELMLMRSLDGATSGVVDGFLVTDGFLAHPSADEQVFLSTPKFTMASIEMPVGPAVFDNSTNLITVANGEDVCILSGFELTLVAHDAWLAHSAGNNNNSSSTDFTKAVSSPNGLGFAFSDDVVIYSTEHALFAINGSNGNVTRLTDLPEPPVNRGVVLVGYFVCTSTEHFLVCGDLHGIDAPWVTPICPAVTDIHNDLVAQGDLLVVTFCRQGALAKAFSPSTRNWTTFGAGNASYRPGVVSDGTVYTVEMLALAAFDLMSGRLRWIVASASVVFISNTIAMGDYVYISVNALDQNTSLAQYNRANGHLHQLVPSPSTLNDTENVYVLGAEGGLYSDGLIYVVHRSSVTIFDTHGSFYMDSIIQGVPPVVLSFPAKPLLTPQGIFLFFTLDGAVAFNAFGFSYLWARGFSSSVDPVQALSVSPQVYGGLLFYSEGAVMTACDVMTGRKRSILAYVPFSDVNAPPIAAAVVSTTLGNLTRVIFSQGGNVISMVSTMYEPSSYVDTDCRSAVTLMQCAVARGADLVGCQWCQVAAYCVSQADVCIPSRQAVLPLVSWANSPATPAINAIMLPAGYAVTADSDYIILLNTSEPMKSILQLPNMIGFPRTNSGFARNPPADGMALGADHVVLIYLPSMIVVADASTMTASNMSFANENRSIVAWAHTPVHAQYIAVTTCLSNFTANETGASRECMLVVVDCLTVPPAVFSYSRPSFFNQSDPEHAIFAMYASNDAFYVMRSALDEPQTTVFGMPYNFTSIFSVETYFKLNDSNVLFVVTDQNSSMRFMIQTREVIYVYDNLTAQETALPMPPSCINFTFIPRVGTEHLFMSCSNELVSVRLSGDLLLSSVFLPDKSSVITGVIGNQGQVNCPVDPLYIIADDFKVYFHNPALRSLVAIFDFGDVKSNGILGLTWIPETSTLVATFQQNMISVTIGTAPPPSNATTAAASWVVAAEVNLLGPAMTDPKTGRVFVAGDQLYNLMGYDPHAAGSGWLQLASFVFDVADYGVQFSGSGDLVVLVGESVRSVEPLTGLSQPALTLPTTVTGESLAVFSSGVVCAADSYVTQCSTAVNGGQCARCAPPRTLFSPTIPYNGLAFTFCDDGPSSFLAVNPLTMEATFAGRERSTFPGLITDNLVMVVSEFRITAYSAIPPYQLVWSKPTFRGYRFCSNAVKVAQQSVTVGQCSITNGSIGAAVYNFNALGFVEWEVRIKEHHEGDPPFHRACLAARSGGILGDGLVAVLTSSALFLFGVNGVQFMSEPVNSGFILWEAKNLVVITPEGLLLVGGNTFKVFNVFTGQLMVSEFRYNSSLVSPEVVGSTVLWSTGELLVATDLISGQCYGQIGYPLGGADISAAAVDPQNSSRVVIGQGSFLMLADISFVNLDLLPQLVPMCSDFITQAACAVGRGNISVGCQWCQKLGYCTEMNNFCQLDCSVWSINSKSCGLAENCAFCSDYGVCVNAPSCRCSLITGSDQCDETNGMCVYSDGLCRVGACFSFIVRGFNSLPFVLFLLGLAKDIVTLAIVGAIEPLTARFVAFFHRSKRNDTANPRIASSTNTTSASSSQRKVVYLDGKFSVSRAAGAALSLEEYACFLIDTTFSWKPLPANQPTHAVLTGSINECPQQQQGEQITDDDLRHKLHSALLLYMLRSYVWITPRAFACAATKNLLLTSRQSQSLTFGSFSPIEGGSVTSPLGSLRPSPPASVEELEELLDSWANHFEPAIYISSSRFTARIVHCISANATTLQLFYYVSTALVLVALTSLEVWNLDLSVVTERRAREVMLRFQLVGFRVMNSSTIGTIALLAVKYGRAAKRQYNFLKSGSRVNILRASQLAQMAEFRSSKLFHGLYWLYFATALPFVLAGSLVGAALYPFIPAGVVVLLVAVLFLSRSRWLKRIAPLNTLQQSWRSARRLPAKSILDESAFVETSDPAMRDDDDGNGNDGKGPNGVAAAATAADEFDADDEDEDSTALRRSEATSSVPVSPSNTDEVIYSDRSAAPPRRQPSSSSLDSTYRAPAVEQVEEGLLPTDHIGNRAPSAALRERGNSIDSVRDLHSNRNLHTLPKEIRRSMRIAYVKREARVGLAALVHFLVTIELPTILLAAMLQACYNYSVLYAHRDFFGVEYWDVPGMDYNARSFQCFQETLVDVFDSAKSSIARAAQVLTSVVPFA